MNHVRANILIFKTELHQKCRYSYKNSTHFSRKFKIKFLFILQNSENLMFFDLFTSRSALARHGNSSLLQFSEDNCWNLNLLRFQICHKKINTKSLARINQKLKNELIVNKRQFFHIFIYLFISYLIFVDNQLNCTGREMIKKNITIFFSVFFTARKYFNWILNYW